VGVQPRRRWNDNQGILGHFRSFYFLMRQPFPSSAICLDRCFLLSFSTNHSMYESSRQLSHLGVCVCEREKNYGRRLSLSTARNRKFVLQQRIQYFSCHASSMRKGIRRKVDCVTCNFCNASHPLSLSVLVHYIL
jgi:hypothetical protein